MPGGFGSQGAGRAALMVQMAGAGGLVLVSGRHETIDADDTVATGLSEVVDAWTELESDVIAAAASVQAVIGDQAGSPAAGSIDIKTWTEAGIPATTFERDVRWYAIGRP